MGFMKNFFSQTRKPEGLLGKFMLSTMNSGHANLADWGMGHLSEISPKEIVELGCGAGRNAGELLKRYPGARLTAIDYSPLSVEKATEYNRAMTDSGRCRVQQGDVSNLQLEENCYDLATAFETIYFWPGLERCFAQVAKILKQGGYFLEDFETGRILPHLQRIRRQRCRRKEIREHHRWHGLLYPAADRG